MIPTGKGDMNPELELYPVMVRLLRHQTQAQRPVQSTTITSVMTGLGGMAISKFLLDYVHITKYSKTCAKDHLCTCVNILI